MSCDVGEATEGLENELWRRYSDRRVGEWTVTEVKWRKAWRISTALPTPQLILQPFRCFTYIVRFSYVTGSSLTSPGEPPMHCGCQYYEHVWEITTFSKHVIGYVVWQFEIVLRARMMVAGTRIIVALREKSCPKHVTHSKKRLHRRDSWHRGKIVTCSCPLSSHTHVCYY